MKTMNILLSQMAAAERDEVADARLGMWSARQLQTALGRANEAARHRDQQMRTSLDTVQSAQSIASQIASMLAAGSGNNGSAAIEDLASGELRTTVRGLIKAADLEGLVNGIERLLDGDLLGGMKDIAGLEGLDADSDELDVLVEVGLRTAELAGLGGIRGAKKLSAEGLDLRPNPLSMPDGLSRAFSRSSSDLVQSASRVLTEDEESGRAEGEDLQDKLVDNARQRLRDALQRREQLLRMSMA